VVHMRQRFVHRCNGQKKAPAIAVGQVKQSGTTSEFGPIRSAASCRVEHFSSGVVRRLGTCQIAPNICSLLPRSLQIGKGHRRPRTPRPVEGSETDGWAPAIATGSEEIVE